MSPLINEIRYQHRDTGDIRQQQQRNEQCDDKRHTLLDKLLHLTPCDRHAREHHGAERRGQAADHDVDVADDAEVHQIDPGGLHDRHHERGEDNERRAALEEHADDEQHDVHDQQHEELVAGKARHGVEQHGGDVLPVEVVAEHGRRHDDEHDGGGAGDGLAQDGDKVLLFQALVDELAHDQAVKARKLPSVQMERSLPLQ